MIYSENSHDESHQSNNTLAEISNNTYLIYWNLRDKKYQQALNDLKLTLCSKAKLSTKNFIVPSLNLEFNSSNWKFITELNIL